MDGKLSWPLLRLIMAFWHNSTLFATQINLNFVHLDFGAPVIKLFSWRKITKFVLQLDRAPCSGSLSRLTKKLFNIQQQRKQRWQLYPCECEWRVSYCKHERMPSLHRFETDRLWDFFLSNGIALPFLITCYLTFKAWLSWHPASVLWQSFYD